MSKRQITWMTRDEALDFAADLYLAGHIHMSLTDEHSTKWIESILTRWNVRITEER